MRTIALNKVAPPRQPGAVADDGQRQDRTDEEQPQDRRGHPRIDGGGDSILVQVDGFVERLDERGHQVSLLRHLRLRPRQWTRSAATRRPTADCWPGASLHRTGQCVAARIREASSGSRSKPVPAGTRRGDTLSGSHSLPRARARGACRSDRMPCPS
jgi:hypothetical protein